MKTEHLENSTISFGSRTIPVTLHWRDRRTIGISVSPDLSVDAFVPREAKREAVNKFLHRIHDIQGMLDASKDMIDAQTLRFWINRLELNKVWDTVFSELGNNA